MESAEATTKTYYDGSGWTVVHAGAVSAANRATAIFIVHPSLVP